MLLHFINFCKLIALSGLLIIIQPLQAQELPKHVSKGFEYMQVKKYYWAIKYFLKAEKKTPMLFTKNCLAYCYAQLDQWETAKNYYLAVLSMTTTEKERAGWLSDVGVCYSKLHNPDSALFYYNQLIYEFPDHCKGYFNKAELFYSLGYFQEARAEYDEVILRDSSNWFYYHKRLETCFAMMDYEAALNDLNRVKELEPDLDDHINRAFCYSMLKRYAEADSIYQIMYNDNDAILLNNMGINKHHLGNSEEGKKLIMRSLELKPDNSFAYRNLAVIAIAENEHHLVCSFLLKAKSLNFEQEFGQEVNDLLDEHCK